SPVASPAPRIALGPVAPPRRPAPRAPCTATPASVLAAASGAPGRAAGGAVEAWRAARTQPPQRARLGATAGAVVLFRAPRCAASTREGGATVSTAGARRTARARASRGGWRPERPTPPGPSRVA